MTLNTWSCCYSWERIINTIIVDQAVLKFWKVGWTDDFTLVSAWLPSFDLNFKITQDMVEPISSNVLLSWNNIIALPKIFEVSWKEFWNFKKIMKMTFSFGPPLPRFDWNFEVFQNMISPLKMYSFNKIM